MAYIIGNANEEEIKRILCSGYDTVSTLTKEQEMGLFGGLREDDDDDKLIMVYVDCDVTDLLSMEV